MNSRNRDCQPNHHDDDGRCPIPGFPLELGGTVPALREHGWRDHPANGQDAERNEYQIVQIPEHRDEVRNQVYRTESICDDDAGESFRIPGNPRVATGEIERVNLALERPDPAVPFFKQRL